MHSLKGAVKLTAPLHEPCAPDLTSIHTGRDTSSIVFSLPEESMWPVNRMVQMVTTVGLTVIIGSRKSAPISHF